jgi:hypothetical protein
MNGNQFWKYAAFVAMAGSIVTVGFIGTRAAISWATRFYATPAEEE